MKRRKHPVCRNFAEDTSGKLRCVFCREYPPDGLCDACRQPLDDHRIADVEVAQCRVAA